MLGDENVLNSQHGSLEADFAAWCEAFWADYKSGDRTYQLSYADSDDEEAEDEADGDSAGDAGGGVVDMEDMGAMMKKGTVR